MTKPNGALKVAVLMGGVGAEREVSLESGRAVLAALRECAVTAIGHDLDPADLSILDDASIDVYFPALHGAFGEDGQLQRLMADRDLCFVGSEAAACDLTFDKLRTKAAVRAAGIRTPEAAVYDPALGDGLMAGVGDGPPWVVKPVCQGSSVGVTFCRDREDVLRSAQTTYASYGACMIERFVDGQEVTVGVLLGEVLPVIEIRPERGFYDYHAKYEAEKTQYLFDTLPAAVNRELTSLARTGFEVLGMRHFGRLDFLVDAEGVPWFLEANAIPGLTAHSLLPKAAQQVGLSMPRLCETLVRAAATRTLRRDL
jgi:D-alanine-D-alanine ligase